MNLKLELGKEKYSKKIRIKIGKKNFPKLNFFVY